MPTYEYRCPKGHEFEHFFRSISAASAEMTCPVCGESATRKVSGGAGLLFKGSGFYITDYGKDGKKDLRQATSKGKGSEDASPGQSPESGPKEKGKGSAGSGSAE